MGDFTELTLKKVERILEGLCSGKYDFVAAACKSERLSRTTFYEWRNAYPENKKRLNEVLDNHRIVEAEDSLFKEVKRGNITALIFFLCNRVPSRWQRNNPPEQAETPESLPVVVRLYCDDKNNENKALVKG